MFTGTWNVNVNLGQGEKAITLNLTQEGERVTGSISGAFGAGEIANASISPSSGLRFTVPLEIEGQTKEATFIGTLSGSNEFGGSVNVVGMSPGTFTGNRARPN
jgi:hypothetical protein